MENQPITNSPVIRTENDLKKVLATNYIKQINNFFGDEKRALKFLSGVMSAVQRNPKLLECTAPSLINSFMIVAQYEFMPSDVSGEAYVLPYRNKGVMEAQFQLGYQGLVSLFYRSGQVKDIRAEIVYKGDSFSYTNGVVSHNPDIFAESRGEAIGSYVIVRMVNSGEVHKVMSKKEIMGIGQKFSKSFASSFSPWIPENDPQLWMWKKTVLKQAAKLLPKNEKIIEAIELDNKDSFISDRVDPALEASNKLNMGSLIKPHDNQEGEKAKEAEGAQA